MTTTTPTIRGAGRASLRLRRALGAAALAGVVAGALALPAAAARDDLVLVSRTGAGAAADGASDEPVASADGRVVAFQSSADNLSDADDNAVQNVFARDLVAGGTVLVSRATGGPGGSEGSGRPSISGDGRFVAFSSRADTLYDDDYDMYLNVFVRDLATGTTTLVSRATGADGTAAQASSDGPAISQDGRFVAFESDADNLSTEDVDTVTNVYVRDLVGNTTTLVSRAGAGGDGASFEPSISADGRRVAFESLADNLSGEDDDNVKDVFVRDMVSGTTTLASRAAGAAGAAASDAAGSSSLSADGRLVAFDSAADNLSDQDNDAVRNVFVRDIGSNTTTLVSRAAGAAGTGGDGPSFFPSISADGRLVTFDSAADDLSGEDDDAVTDVFVRDLVAATTTLASRATGAAGAAGTGSSERPTISADGRMVAFASDAQNISGLDDDFVTDVFVRDLSPAAGPGPGPGAGVGPQPTRVIRARCAGARATIVGTAGRDLLRGTPRRDVIAALGGNDRVLGLGGNDLICLGPGADRASGGAGADRILGGPGRDRLLGGPGRDRLLGGPGRDEVRR